MERASQPCLWKTDLLDEVEEESLILVKLFRKGTDCLSAGGFYKCLSGHPCRHTSSKSLSGPPCRHTSSKSLSGPPSPSRYL